MTIFFLLHFERLWVLFSVNFSYGKLANFHEIEKIIASEIVKLAIFDPDLISQIRFHARKNVEFLHSVLEIINFFHILSHE